MVLFLLRKKLRPIDFSEAAEESLTCRSRWGSGQRGSTTRWVLQQWHSLSKSGPPPRSLPTAWLSRFPIFDHKPFFAALVEHFSAGLQVVDEQEAVGLPRGFLVDGLQLLLGQQGRQFSSSSWLRRRQTHMNCMFTRTAALMSRSFWELTQVEICM